VHVPEPHTRPRGLYGYSCIALADVYEACIRARGLYGYSCMALEDVYEAQEHVRIAYIHTDTGRGSCRYFSREGDPKPEKKCPKYMGISYFQVSEILAKPSNFLIFSSENRSLSYLLFFQNRIIRTFRGFRLMLFLILL
jgi:hypothetical protein